ncbi:MAG TPA: AAC(3) family N-acetyltransferase, partial [Dongiaceae bacterium]|nr:AAC(3) family N-acetyltransferase [Dongiaceae bacterium]
MAEEAPGDREIPKTHLIAQLRELGVEPGGVLLVHASFRAVRPIEGGPLGLIEALHAALGPRGTLVMPSMTDDDDRVFDPATTSARGMGIVADSFWRVPGVRRSNHFASFAASGPRAAGITADHPPVQPHGPESPVDRVRALDGQILVLGVGHDANTTVHLAECLAGA